jgi:NAD(P)-dependent dehydrogenase (short-subunit alcohol dehydrogenase family)
MERWGWVDALFNSAWHGPRAPLLDLSDEDWHRGMEVYFLNVVRRRGSSRRSCIARNPARSSARRPSLSSSPAQNICIDGGLTRSV